MDSCQQLIQTDINIILSSWNHVLLVRRSLLVRSFPKNSKNVSAGDSELLSDEGNISAERASRLLLLRGPLYL